MGSVLGILISLGVISLYEIKCIRTEGGKKEIAMFVILMAAAGSLYIAQRLHAKLPNPLEGIEMVMNLFNIH